jgi:hypothetical protein
MRKRRQKWCGFGRRFTAIHRGLPEEDDPSFDEREMEFSAAEDERVIPPEH